MAEEPGVGVMGEFDCPPRVLRSGSERCVMGMGCTPGVQRKSAEAVEEKGDELQESAKE